MILTNPFVSLSIIQKESRKKNIFMEYAKTMDEAYSLVEKTDFVLIIIRTDSVDYGSGLEKMLKMKPILILLLSYCEIENKMSAVQNGKLRYSLTAYNDNYLVKASIELAKHYAKMQNSRNEIGTGLLTHGYIDLYIDAYQVFLKGEQIMLTKKEFYLLKYFMTNIGIVLTYEQIYNHVCESGSSLNINNVIQGLVHRLREKLSNGPDSSGYITAFPGTGYKFG